MTLDEAVATIATLRAQLETVRAQLVKALAELENRRGFVARATRGDLAIPILGGGLLRRGWVGRASTGFTTSTGDQGNLVVNPPPSSVSWNLFPVITYKDPATGLMVTGRGFIIDRSKPFPQYVPDIKKRFLNDPLKLVGSVEVI